MLIILQIYLIVSLIAILFLLMISWPTKEEMAEHDLTAFGYIIAVIQFGLVWPMVVYIIFKEGSK